MHSPILTKHSPPQSELAQQLVKDPYNFDLLTLGPEMLERDLERSLIEHGLHIGAWEGLRVAHRKGFEAPKLNEFEGRKARSLMVKRQGAGTACASS